eukprot:3677286-Rhodomonas_salina.1
MGLATPEDEAKMEGWPMSVLREQFGSELDQLIQAGRCVLACVGGGNEAGEAGRMAVGDMESRERECVREGRREKREREKESAGRAERGCVVNGVYV